MKEQNIEELLDKYFGGESSLEEERVIKEYFTKEEVPAHLKKFKPIFNSFNRAATQVVPNSDKIFIKIAEEEKENKKIKPLYPSKGREWTYRVAASVALIIVGFGAGVLFSKYGSSAGPEELTALRNDVKEMKELMLLTKLNEVSPSERLMAVNASYEMNDADQKVIDALINTMNIDKNVNVRLAAAQALVRFKDNPKVKDALIQSLKLQDNPIMQITLIDLLVELKEKSALYELQVLLQKENLMDMVKKKAQSGISELQSI